MKITPQIYLSLTLLLFVISSNFIYSQSTNDVKLILTTASKNRLGVGAEYGIAINEKTTLTLGVQYLRNINDNKPLNRTTVKEMILNIRLCNYFQFFEAVNLSHYLGLYAAAGLIDAAYSGSLGTGSEQKLAAVAGGQLGLLRIILKEKISLELFTKFGYRMTELGNIEINDSPTGGKRFVALTDYNKGVEASLNLGIGYFF